jgi:hypothetical protein
MIVEIIMMINRGNVIIAGLWYTSHLHSFDFVIGEVAHKENLALDIAGFESETFQIESQPVPLDPRSLTLMFFFNFCIVQPRNPA